MTSNTNQDFAEFLASLRAGNETAVQQFAGRFDSIVRREIRMQMLDPRLRRILDTDDILQNILASFFLRAAAGQYELDNSNDLIRLLIDMARKKTAAAARGHYRKRRDLRRHEALGEFEPLDHSVQTPSQLVAYEEILQRVNQDLSPEELEIKSLRQAGMSWQVIAKEMGGTPDGRRMQLLRAADRVSHALGLDAIDA